ncbi:MAG TPA: polysaccharide deacetylase family protein [Candidatus Saccharimonadales bacterium]|nr:polysaccharide deacetylase family protein [Candidatus Saccharimonadales bacterium]
MKRIRSIYKILLASAIALCVVAQAFPIAVHAATTTVSNPAPSAKVSFTFDDGLASAYTQAAPTLAKYGLSGTNYIITNCVGMVTAPNTCRANTTLPYMSWTQVQALQNTYGWELGSHTVDHNCLADSAATDPDDCQKNLLTQAQVAAEMTQSKSALASHGITATDFAPPYGDYNNMVMAQIAKYYASMRQFKNTANNPNIWPYSDYLLNDKTIQETTDTVASIKTAIDAAIANNQWLILTFHDIAQKPSKTPDDYQYGTAELDQIAAYVKSKQDAGLIKSVHVNQGLVTSTTNLLPNASFNSGIAGGWTTDDPLGITKDAGTNGSYPDPTNSIKLTSNATGKTTHLFSPQVAVDPNSTYMMKNFLNVSALSTGEVAFYVDEYDANGNWVSGKYLKAENSVFVENLNFTYKPTSMNVAKARLQVIVAGTGITAYLDNTQMFPLNATTAPTNLVANGTFDAGIASGWTTDDSANIVADKANNGSPNNPVNSIAFKSNTTGKNGHLFSPQVAITAGKTYSLSAYLNLKTLTSNEVGFYIDEYDASGNWISGQYRLGVHALGAGDVGMSYTPSSAAVAKASLQVIVVTNSGLSGYLDDIRWYAN